MSLSIFFTNILIHVGVMALFLTIFFFTVAQYFEKKIVEKQIDFVIDDFVGNTLKPISKETKKEIQEKITKAFEKQDFSKSDEAVKKQNSEIMKKAWTFVGILLAIIIVIVIILGFVYKWEGYYWRFLFNSSLLGLIFVALTEFIFMFLIAQNYLSADPNKIKLSIIQTLINNRCFPCEHQKDKDYLDKCLGSLPCKK